MKRFLQVLISFLALISYGQQGNYKFNNYGNRSILLSGNVTGSVTDIGLTYYNPSRLTEAETTAFAFNARAYQLSSLKVSNVFAEDSNINSTSFNGAPSMAGGTFNLFGTRFGYSFISKSRVDNNIGYSSDVIEEDILDIFPDAEAYKITSDLRTKVKDDWFGLTWAKKITEKFSLGVSLFGSNYEYSSGGNLDQTIDASESVAFYQNTIGFYQKSYGLFIKLGANYHFETFDLGLNVNVPYIEVYDEGGFNYNNLISGVGSEFDQFYTYDLQNLEAQRKEPLGVSVGAGVPIGKGKLHLNIDYVNGLAAYNRIDIPSIDTGNTDLIPVLFQEKRKNVFNFGAGIEIFMSDRVKSYLGFTTDCNALTRNVNLFDLSTNGSREVTVGEDFIHYSVGIDLKLNFASVILGTTHTSSSSEFTNSIDFNLDGSVTNENSSGKFEYSRWQFVIGFEIPVFEKEKPIKKEN
jgi:hypothetical protein